MIMKKKTILAVSLLLMGIFSSVPGLSQGNGPKGEAYLLIDKQAFTLTYFDASGKAVKTYGIACGQNYGNKQKRGDHKTPEGTFKINQLLNAKGIPHDFKDGKGPIKDAYGPWFFRLDVPGYRDIGIHGTHLPSSIGSRVTEGCIRMRNEDILELKPSVFLGMTVIILPDKE